jgi:UDP-GlcNAc:undecaprenyl-phosphate GlcNAc-1-phosphate transferase
MMTHSGVPSFLKTITFRLIKGARVCADPHACDKIRGGTLNHRSKVKKTGNAAGGWNKRSAVSYADADWKPHPNEGVRRMGKLVALQVVYVYGGILAFALTVLVQWLLIPLAPRLDLIDHPKGRKNHTQPTPIIGGLAMLCGILVTGLLLGAIDPSAIGFAVASIVLVGVGLLDDKYDLSWRWRIPAQVAAALIMIYVGGVRVEQLGSLFGLPDTSLGMFSVPFTVFATVGIINAINMVDGIDGLAGLLVLTALLMLGAAALYSGNGVVIADVLVLVGAVMGFLTYNLRFSWLTRAKVFMGNSGSALLGLAIAWVAFRLTQSTRHPVSPVLALWLVPIPIADCLVLMLRRTRNHQSPFVADHNHIHHLMLDAGFSHTQLAVALSVFSLLCGLTASLFLRMHLRHPLFLSSFFVLCAVWYWLTSQRARVVSFFRWSHSFRLPGASYDQRRADARPEGAASAPAKQESES